jgi:hypothetical protein
MARFLASLALSANGGIAAPLEISGQLVCRMHAPER